MKLLTVKNQISSIFFCLVAISLWSCEQKNSNDPEASPAWRMTSYNFGRLDELSIQDQIDLLHTSGYQGIILKSATEKDYVIFEEYVEAINNTDDFELDAVFERYNFEDDSARRERWRKVVDRIAGKNIQLWVIFGKKVEGYDDEYIENKLREMVAYATPKKVEVILYPHSSCYIESAEEALPFVDKINHPNLNLAVHLYHEVRAKNGSRMDEVFKAVGHRIGAVTLAGSDSIADYSSPYTRDTSTIKPLYRGNYKMNDFITLLKQYEYEGSIGIMNFSIKDDPQIYIPQSMKIWNRFNK